MRLQSDTFDKNDQLNEDQRLITTADYKNGHDIEEESQNNILAVNNSESIDIRNYSNTRAVNMSHQAHNRTFSRQIENDLNNTEIRIANKKQLFKGFIKALDQKLNDRNERISIAWDKQRREQTTVGIRQTRQETKEDFIRKLK